MSEPTDISADESQTPGFDFRTFEKVIGHRMTPLVVPASVAKEDDAFQEIAEDLLDLLKRIKGLEESQSKLINRLDQLDATVRDGLRSQAMEVDQLRRDLLGEQSGMAVRMTAEAILPAIDKLRPLQTEAGKNRRRNEAYANQLDAALEALTGMLRSLGFTSYEPTINTPFDPTTMLCAGEAKGAPGVVLGVVQPGYRVQDLIFRPARVLLAPITKPS